MRAVTVRSVGSRTPMPFCSNCGQPVHTAARFCDSCGTALSGAPPTFPSSAIAVAQAPLAPAVVVVAQRGGLLAFKGFLLFLVVAVISLAPAPTTTGKTIMREAGVVIAYGISAAYIITNLRKWKRQNQPIKGAGIGWTVAAFFLILCLGATIRVALVSGGLMNVQTGSKAGSAAPSQAALTPSTPSPSHADSQPAAPPPRNPLRQRETAAPEKHVGFVTTAPAQMYSSSSPRMR